MKANSPRWLRLGWACCLLPGLVGAGAPASGAELSRSVNGRQVRVRSASQDAATIREVMRHVGVSAVPPAPPGQRRARIVRCELSGDSSDPLVARLELYCDGWQVVFVRLCPGGVCRYELASRQYLPRPPARAPAR